MYFSQSLAKVNTGDDELATVYELSLVASMILSFSCRRNRCAPRNGKRRGTRCVLWQEKGSCGKCFSFTAALARNIKWRDFNLILLLCVSFQNRPESILACWHHASLISLSSSFPHLLLLMLLFILTAVQSRGVGYPPQCDSCLCNISYSTRK